MTDINLHNYEAFLLDYSEGHLNGADTEALILFVSANPQLAIQLDELTLPTLIEEQITIDFKNDLKKNESDFSDELLLNYLEGNLSPQQKINFEEQLKQNAALAESLAMYTKTILVAEPVSFEYKASLLKTEDAFILNNRAIAYVEDQLSIFEKINFEKELQVNPTLKNELALILKTKAIADTSIIYPDKPALKKENKVIALFSFRTLAALAAAILLLVGLVVVFNQNTNKPVPVSGLSMNNEGNKQPVKTPAPVTRKHDQSTGAKNLAAATGLKHIQPNNTAKQANASSANAGGKILKQQASALAKNRTNNVNSLGATHPNKATPENNSGNKKEITQSEIANNNAVKPATKDVSPALNNDGTHVAATTKNAMAPDSTLPDQNNFTHQTFLASTTDEPEPETNDAKPAKKGFWQKAVQLAKRANKLGVKSIDGVEKPNNSYSLSFNSFSVEKK